jgi:hypothetical protein
MRTTISLATMTEDDDDGFAVDGLEFQSFPWSILTTGEPGHYFCFGG